VRLAAFDVGTNSTRLLVADVAGGGIVAEQAREMVITRLGKGVDRTGRFDPEALARTLEVLEGYAETCRRLGVERRRLVATSATRDAADRQAFLDGVRDLLGVDAEVLTGQAEAAATYRGATAGLQGDQPTLVVDIGGGSTELIIGDRLGRPRAARSLDVGSVRMTERHLLSDPPGEEEVAAAAAEIDAALDTLPGYGVRVRDAGTVIGVAGTVTTVAAMVLDLPSYQRDRIHHALLPVPDVDKATARLLGMTVEQRRALPFMHPGRADVIGAGALILDRVLLRAEPDPGAAPGQAAEPAANPAASMLVSESDILDGIAWSVA
jgi:exopolyphosphatase/guanosine-5'-triphosphate,3'-diphosphate pyrophosphatase